MKEINLVIHDNNTDSFKRELEKLGVLPHPCGLHTKIKQDKLFINRGFYSNIFIGYEEEEKIIDCSNYKNLVIDLIKYNPNIDKDQWFVFDDTEYRNEGGIRFFFKCKSKSIEIDLCYDMMFTFCDRLTIDQIVDHYLNEGA